MAKIFYEKSIPNSVIFSFGICRDMLSDHEEVPEEEAEYKIIGDHDVINEKEIGFSDFFILHNVKFNYTKEEVENILKMCFCDNPSTGKLGMDLFKNVDVLKHKNVIKKIELDINKNDGYWKVFVVRRILKKVLELKE